jgi:hypothetical protein
LALDPKEKEDNNEMQIENAHPEDEEFLKMQKEIQVFSNLFSKFKFLLSREVS